MPNNEVTQTIKLDNKDFVGPLKQATAQVKTSADDMNKALTDNSKSFVQNEGQIKKWGHAIGEELKKFKNEFSSNLATGAQALTLGLGSSLVKHTAKDAVAMAMEASKTFADLRSRTGASTTQIEKWEKAVGSASVKTKTNVATMEKAFSDLSDSVDNPEKLLDFMDTVGNATMMNGGDSKGVTDFIKNALGGQGKEVNKANVNELMGGADILRRNSKGFGSLGSSMNALGSLDANSVKQSGLNTRDLASILAGASKSGTTPEKALEGIKGLLAENAKGQTSAFAGLIGAKGGTLMGANGKFDISKLNNDKARSLTHMGKDEATSMAIFKDLAKQSGMSDDAAEATFKMIRNFNDLNSTLQKSEKDQKAFSQSAAEAADNLKDNFQMLETSMTVGFREILGGFEKPLNSLLNGHLGEAASQTVGAVGQAGKGIMDHPMLAGGAVLATAAGGALLTSLLPKLLGKGGSAISGAADLAKGVGIGSSLKSMGVTPVYVVNAQDIGKDQSTMMSTIKDMMGGGVAGIPKVAAGMGFLGKLGMVGAAGAAGAAVGTGINAISDHYGGKNQYSQDYGLIEKGIAKLLPEALGGMTSEQYKQNYTVKVEVDSKDPMFSARPKATDLQRDGKTQ